MATGFEDIVLRIGAVAGALGITVASIAALLRFSTKHFVASVREVVEGHLDDIKTNTDQLKPNGGSSLADAVRRVEARQIEIAGETKAVRQALETHLADHKRLP